MRHAVYRFRSVLARGWRNGRLLIAGDAAHLMPPFLGQGNVFGHSRLLEPRWKLNRVLKGSSRDGLLDAYEAERGPNVDAYVRLSMEVGKIVCAPDAEAANARDAAFASGALPPPLDFPGLSGASSPRVTARACSPHTMNLKCLWVFAGLTMSSAEISR